jgi:hypothetical protein
MKRVSVDSSWIARVGYDNSLSTLEIALRDGHAYQYFEIPERHFHALTAGAGSVGQYVNRHIRDSYRYRQIR